MTVQVKEITTPGELKDFINFPFRLYQNNPCWVPPMAMDELNTLRHDRNPAFEHCRARYWMAYINGEPVGRVAAIFNHRHVEKWNQRYLRFGWLDFIDDLAVSQALFAEVEAWARHENLGALHGPLGFTDLDREGMLIEGFNELGTFATLYNHPYYPQHMEALGFRKDTDWMEYEIKVPSEPDPRITRTAKMVLERNNLHMLNARRKQNLLPHARNLFHLLDDAYQHLYGTVPLNKRQVDAYVKQYFDFINPEFVPVVLDANNQMVAFGIAMPSLSRALKKSRGRIFPLGFVHLLSALKKNDRADLYLVAIHSQYQGKGINAPLIDQIIRAFNRFGITHVESNPELETNSAVQAQWKHFETRQHKRRRCYIKEITTNQA